MEEEEGMEEGRMREEGSVINDEGEGEKMKEGSRFELGNGLIRKKGGLISTIANRFHQKSKIYKESINFRKGFRIMTFGIDKDPQKKEEEKKMEDDLAREGGRSKREEEGESKKKEEEEFLEEDEIKEIEKKGKEKELDKREVERRKWEEKQSADELNGAFLKPKLLIYEYIFKSIVKVDGKLTILTVKKHNFLKFWKITLYFPLTTRTFECSLYSSVRLHFHLIAN